MAALDDFGRPESMLELTSSVDCARRVENFNGEKKGARKFSGKL